MESQSRFPLLTTYTSRMTAKESLMFDCQSQIGTIEQFFLHLVQYIQRQKARRICSILVMHTDYVTAGI